MKIGDRIRTVETGAVMVATLLLLATPSLAGGNRTRIHVSASIQPMISQEVVRQERNLTITQEDVKSGYVDVPAATVLQVKTNSRDGYYLIFEFSPELAKEAWIMDQNRTTVLANTIGTAHQSSPGLSGEVKELSYRFILQPDTEPGLYAMPIQVAASLM